MKFIFPFLFCESHIAGTDCLGRHTDSMADDIICTSPNLMCNRFIISFYFVCCQMVFVCLAFLVRQQRTHTHTHGRTNAAVCFAPLYMGCLSDFLSFEIISFIFVAVELSLSLLFGRRLYSHFQSAVKNDGILTTMDCVICVYGFPSHGTKYLVINAK